MLSHTYEMTQKPARPPEPARSSSRRMSDCGDNDDGDVVVISAEAGVNDVVESSAKSRLSRIAKRSISDGVVRSVRKRRGELPGLLKNKTVKAILFKSGEPARCDHCCPETKSL